MSLALTFPDVETLLTTYLRANLPAGTVVGIYKPAAMAGKSVVIVRRDGGPGIGRALDVATVTVRVFVGVAGDATDEDAATDLINQVRMLISAMRDIDDLAVSDVDILSGPTPVTDDSQIPCRYLTCQLYVLGS